MHLLNATNSTWVIGQTSMEDEIRFFESLAQPEVYPDPLELPVTVKRKNSSAFGIDNQDVHY